MAGTNYHDVEIEAEKTKQAKVIAEYKSYSITNPVLVICLTILAIFVMMRYY